MTSYDPQHYLLCQLFLALSVLIYLATALLYAHTTPGKLGNAADATLLFGPAVAGFGLQVGLVKDMSFGAAFSALAFGAVYVGLAAFTLRKRRDEMRLSERVPDRDRGRLRHPGGAAGARGAMDLGGLGARGSGRLLGRGAAGAVDAARVRTGADRAGGPPSC